MLCKSQLVIARMDFLSPHQLLLRLMIIMFQRRLQENWDGELYCTSVEHKENKKTKITEMETSRFNQHAVRQA